MRDEANIRSRVYRRAALGVVATVMVAAGSVAGLAVAADSRLTQADSALETARALVDASECGSCSEQKQRTFDRYRQRAISFIDRARAEIASAKAEADAP
ncbi:MAG: hypothetical protein ACRDKJ_13505 [Actinomycetota bacterium]